MAHKRDHVPVVTVLRGAQLQQHQASAGLPLSVRSSTVPTTPPSPANGGSGKLINGVPASAAMHCCGRGCAHCRIYWRKIDG